MNPHQNVAVAAGQTTIRLRRSYSPELTALTEVDSKAM